MSNISSTGTVLGLVPYRDMKDESTGEKFGGLTIWYTLDGDQDDKESIGIIPLKAFIRDHPLVNRFFHDRSSVGHYPCPAKFSLQVKPTKSGVSIKMLDFEPVRNAS